MKITKVVDFETNHEAIYVEGKLIIESDSGPLDLDDVLETLARGGHIAEYEALDVKKESNQYVPFPTRLDELGVIAGWVISKDE